MDLGVTGDGQSLPFSIDFDRHPYIGLTTLSHYRASV